MSHSLSQPSLPKHIEELRREPVDSFLSDLVKSSIDTSLAKIVGLFREREIYEVFLPEGKRCGMISARDVLKTTNIESTKPQAVMTYVPVISRQSSVGEAAHLMADHRITSLPISDGKKIIGQVNSISILAGLMGKISGNVRVTSLATMDPITIEGEASSAKARELMIRKRIDHLPVTKQKRLEGIITSGAILGHMATPERLGSKSMTPEARGVLEFAVRDAMESSPLTCSPDTAAEQALELMLAGTRFYILVTQWEELQGIATSRDFMTLLAEVEPETDVPVFIVGLPDDPFEAEATKAKFRRIVSQMRKVFPDIVEARSVIKSKFSKPGKERGRYEVTVQIRTSTDSYTYSEEGWELPAVYDVITDRLKRLMTHKRKPRRQRERESEETF
jgi:CBS domain-containing protein